MLAKVLARLEGVGMKNTLLGWLGRLSGRLQLELEFAACSHALSKDIQRCFRPLRRLEVLQVASARVAEHDGHTALGMPPVADWLCGEGNAVSLAKGQIQSLARMEAAPSPKPQLSHPSLTPKPQAPSFHFFWLKTCKYRTLRHSSN